MAPSTRSNTALLEKIATLQLTLSPFVPLPRGPPHPAFPKTLMAFNLLTEDELDSLAHYYHQSTPGPYTLHYPVTMNWDKDFLGKPTPVPIENVRRLSQQEQDLLRDLLQTVNEINTGSEALHGQMRQSEQRRSSVSKRLSKKERMRIKRRKFGKFIGLRGMDTPIEEIAGRLQASLDRAVERAKQEQLEIEESIMKRKKAF